MSEVEKLLEQAVREGVISCLRCKGSLEPDAEECSCGWRNPLVAGGLI